jgi:hypothetical protein
MKQNLITLLMKLQKPHEHKCGLCGIDINKCRERIIKLIHIEKNIKK